jgi:hypothetical protein
MQALSYNFLRKGRKYQVPATMTVTPGRCVEGIRMNWETFLLNQILMDFEEA